jgi:hypothetical protein
VTEALECDLDAWQAFLSSDEWNVADVTAPGMDATGNYALALIPTEETMERFLRSCAPSAASLVDAFKVRLYVRPIETGVRAVAVPIAMLAPASPAALDNALAAVVARLEAEDAPLGLDWQAWDAKAKHRLLQLYASICVLADLWPQIQKSFSVKDLTSALESLPVSLYFGDAATAIMGAFARAVHLYQTSSAGAHPVPGQIRLQEPVPAWFLLDDGVQRMFWEAQELLEGVGLPIAPGTGELTKAGLLFSHAVSAVFGFLNREYELPQREKIRALGNLDAYERWLGDGTPRVLSQGITLRELGHFLLPPGIEDSVWSRSLVSLAVDEGNDLGVMVPVTRYDKTRDVVSRSYRIGETAPLAGSPLVEATMSDRADDDYFIRAMLTRGPVDTRTTLVSDFVASPRWEASPIARDALERWVRSTLPGRPIERFLGRIVEITEEVVEAQLLSPAEDDERRAHIPIDRVDGALEGLVGKGSQFTWTLFERRTPGLVRRAIDIKVRKLPLIDLDELDRDEVELPPDDDDDEDAAPR